jgi:hypothetical protein
MKLSPYLDSVPPPSVGPRKTIVLGPEDLLRARARSVPLPVTVGKPDLWGGETHQVQVHAGSNY